jgi:hypothetical protein
MSFAAETLETQAALPPAPPAALPSSAAGANPTTAAPVPTRAEMLERLRTSKTMLEEGLISQAEHDDVKSEVLAALKRL